MSIVIFSKFLTKTDIESRLAVPTNVLEHINMPVGANYVNLSPTDSDGKEWSFRCYTRLDGHPKPAFTTGWLNFVKGLQIGDKVTFSKLEDGGEAGGAPSYIIHAARPRTITLMGAEVEGWIDLP